MWIQSNCEIIMLIKEEWNAYKWWWEPYQKSKWRMGSCFEIFRPQKEWIQCEKNMSENQNKFGFVGSSVRFIFERNKLVIIWLAVIFNWNSGSWIQPTVTLLGGKLLKKKGFLVSTNLFPSASIVQKALAEK